MGNEDAVTHSLDKWAQSTHRPCLDPQLCELGYAGARHNRVGGLDGRVSGLVTGAKFLEMGIVWHDWLAALLRL